MFSIFSAADAAVIVAVIGGVATWMGVRTRKEIRQINRAVNHQGDDQPTLIQRVIRLEENQAIHTSWTEEALKSVAAQIGAQLPERPASIVIYADIGDRDPDTRTRKDDHQ